MASIKLAKASLRKEIKAKLAQISPEEISKQTGAVLKQLLNHKVFKASQRVSIYLNMPKEIGTEDIVRFLLDNDKECFIPKYSVGNSPSMDMVQLQSWDDLMCLPSTTWKIKQPADDDQRPDALQSGGLDVMVIPGLAFNMAGDRLGHGRGYYDAYLRDCIEAGNKPYCIGLALHQQIVANIPKDIHDIVMNEVMVAPS